MNPANKALLKLLSKLVKFLEREGEIKPEPVPAYHAALLKKPKKFTNKDKARMCKGDPVMQDFYLNQRKRQGNTYRTSYTGNGWNSIV